MKKQPNSRNCFVCGVNNPAGLHLEFYEVEPGFIRAEIIVPEQFQGYPGVVHGGIVAAMLDEVSGRTVLQGDPPRWMVTAKLDVRYRKPVPINERIYLEGKAKEDRGRLAVVVGTIYNGQRDVLAEAEAVLADIPKHLLGPEGMAPDDWKIYPDKEVG
jgi:acyl-coenzyme A thioesterase PaaI-like protein